MVLSARYSRLREFASSVSSTSMWMSRSCRLARSKQMSMCARASASLYSYQGSPPTTSQPCLSASSSSSAAPGSRTIPSCGKATTWISQRRAYFSRTSSSPSAARKPPIVPTSANRRKNVVPFLIPVSITRPARCATSCASYLRLKSLVISIASGSVPETFGRMTSPSSALSACRCRLTKPGTTRSPAASMVCAADAARLGATAAIRPCSMPISTSWSRPRSRALRMRRFMAYQFASASRSAASSHDRAPPSNPLQNVQTARAVDEVDQAAVVVADVVALDARRPCGHRRHERCGLARGVRIGDVDNSQAMRKPGDGNFRAAHLFAKLVQTGVVLFRRPVLLFDLEARERNRTRFVGDVDDPQERRRGRAEAHDVFVGDQHHAAAAQHERHWQRGMGRPGKRRRPVEAGHELWPAQIRDVENHEPAVPIADVEPIAVTDGMMTAMRRALPRRRLAAGRPLPRHPPFADELGARRIREIDDADDVAEIAIHFRRAVDVTAIEGKAMHAAAGEARDTPRLGRAADIVDLEPAAKVRVLAADRKDFAVDQHHAVLNPHLVGQGALGNADFRKLARLGGIADVDDAGAVRRRDVADIGDPLAHDHLPAAITIEVADDLYTVTMPAVHAQPDEDGFDKTLSCACARGQPIELGRHARVHAFIRSARRRAR